MQNGIKEFGSQFECVEASGEKPWVPAAGTAYLRSGRECLYHIGQIGLQQGIRRVLMPALCCPAMVQPFLELGCTVMYYPLGEDLTVDFTALEAALTDNSLLLVMHYYGRRGYSLSRLKALLQNRKNVLTVQDCTQNGLSPELYDSGIDYHIASIRKWLPIADGATIHSAARPLPSVEYIADGFAEKWFDAMGLKTEYLATGQTSKKDTYRKLFAECTASLRSRVVMNAMSPISRGLYAAVNVEEVQVKRRANFKALLEILQAERPELVRYCMDQTCPLCLPIVVEDQEAVQRALAQRNVYCQVLWPLPEGGAAACENSRWFATHMLAVPCDQRYSVEDMRHIAGCICDVTA